MFQNECRYRFATFAAFDLPKSTIKIAYPERKRMEKKTPMVKVKVFTAGRLYHST